MSCDVDSAFDIFVVVFIAYIGLKNAFTHSRFQMIRKQEQQKIKKAFGLVGIRF